MLCEGKGSCEVATGGGAAVNGDGEVISRTSGGMSIAQWEGTLAYTAAS